MASDPLARFLEAQDGGVFDGALGELTAGRKTGHWMWFVFPQLAGLGRSETARFYALPGLAAARAYSSHPVLGARLHEAVGAMMRWSDRRSAAAILGPVDAIKLRSCLTLFAAACPQDTLFNEALAAFYEGEPDPLTLARL